MNPFVKGVVAGGTAGVIGMTACYPLNVSILHQRHDEGQSLLKTARKIVQEQGLSGFRKDYSTYVFRVGLGTAIFGVVVPFAEQIYSTI